MGVLDRGERDKDNATGLKEGGGIGIENYSAFHIRDARSLRFCIYLPVGGALASPIGFGNFKPQTSTEISISSMSQ